MRELKEMKKNDVWVNQANFKSIFKFQTKE